VTGETFHRAYAAWGGGRGPSGQPLPWLLLITRRLVIDKARRRKLIS
jgi:DNA-directed RNA polymerase specialized sigma24 family protein